MIVLDTNVISEAMRRDSDPAVMAWLDRQQSESTWTTAISVFELSFGVELLAGRRRRTLHEALERILGAGLDGRVLPFDQAAARQSSVIAARQRRSGRPVEIRDVEIAGIVAAHGPTLATRNTRDFEAIGLSVVNPWDN